MSASEISKVCVCVFKAVAHLGILIQLRKTLPSQNNYARARGTLIQLQKHRVPGA
jgi:uncharacterized protein YjiS (DUF1127 family)